MELKRKLSLWAYTGDLDELLEIVEEYMFDEHLAYHKVRELKESIEEEKESTAFVEALLNLVGSADKEELEQDIVELLKKSSNWDSGTEDSPSGITSLAAWKIVSSEVEKLLTKL